MNDIYKPKITAGLMLVADWGGASIGLHPNQRWIMDREYKDEITLVNGNVRMRLPVDMVNRYFRRIEADG